MFNLDQQNKTTQDNKIRELKPEEPNHDFELSVSNIHTMPKKFLPSGRRTESSTPGKYKGKLWVLWLVIIIVIGGLVGLAAYFLISGSNSQTPSVNLPTAGEQSGNLSFNTNSLNNQNQNLNDSEVNTGLADANENTNSDDFDLNENSNNFN